MTPISSLQRALKKSLETSLDEFTSLCCITIAFTDKSAPLFCLDACSLAIVHSIAALLAFTANSMTTSGSKSSSLFFDCCRPPRLVFTSSILSDWAHCSLTGSTLLYQVPLLPLAVPLFLWVISGIEIKLKRQNIILNIVHLPVHYLSSCTPKPPRWT